MEKDKVGLLLKVENQIGSASLLLLMTLHCTQTIRDMHTSYFKKVRSIKGTTDDDGGNDDDGFVERWWGWYHIIGNAYIFLSLLPSSPPCFTLTSGRLSTYSCSQSVTAPDSFQEKCGMRYSSGVCRTIYYYPSSFSLFFSSSRLNVLYNIIYMQFPCLFSLWNPKVKKACVIIWRISKSKIITSILHYYYWLKLEILAFRPFLTWKFAVCNSNRQTNYDLVTPG